MANLALLGYCRDLTEKTVAGAAISLLSGSIILFLLTAVRQMGWALHTFKQATIGCLPSISDS